MRLLALFVAFAINFILLFYKVSIILRYIVLVIVCISGGNIVLFTYIYMTKAITINMT